MKMKGKVEKMGENKQMEEKNPPVVRLGRELKYQGTILKILFNFEISCLFAFLGFIFICPMF